MLACVKPTSAVGSSAVLYVPTPHPLPPPFTLYLFSVLVLVTYILPDSLFFYFNLSYIYVFLCWNLICPVGVCVSVIIESMKVGDATST